MARKPPSSREKKQRVRSAGSRTASSARWLERHINDPYVHEAQRQGLRSRAAFKLLDIDAKVKILRPGLRVVDLGAAPGGWTQIVAERARPKRLVAIDILPMDPIAGADILHLDFTLDEAPEALKACLNGPADLVLSDLSPNTTGHKQTDHLRMVALVEMAWEFAQDVLAPGGAFVAKVFQGGTQHELLAQINPYFAKVQHVKPASSRSESSEIYLVCTGFKTVP